jgi:hypothetical protein
MVDIRTSEFTGIHRTFLTADAKKARVLTLGRKLGSAIKIDPDDAVHEGLAVAEGIESAIAARFMNRPAWSLIDANGINGFPVLPGIEHLAIFADNDANKTGEIAAGQAMARNAGSTRAGHLSRRRRRSRRAASQTRGDPQALRCYV